MRVQYETKVEDLQEWRRFYLSLPEIRGYLWNRRMTKGVFVACPVFILLTLSWHNPLEAMLWGSAAFGMSMFLEKMGELRQWRAALKNVIENRDGMSPLGKNTLEVTDESVAQSAELFTHAFHWELVRRVFVGRRHVYFVLKNYQAIVVSRESIEPASERETFIERLERCMPVELRGDGEDAAD